MAKTKLSEEQTITLAQVQAIGTAYTSLKTIFENSKQEAKTSKANYQKLERRISELSELIEEEEDFTVRQQLRDELAEDKKKLEQLKTDTVAKQAVKTQLKSNLDSNIEAIKNLPGVREAIQEIVSKKYDEQIKNVGKLRKNVVEDEKNLMKIGELIDEDKTDSAPEISDSFKDMLDTKNEMKKAKEEMAKIDEKLAATANGGQQAQLQQEKANMQNIYNDAQTRYQAAKAQFMTLSGKEDADFDEQQIDRLVDVVNNGMTRRPGKENNYSLERVIQKQTIRTDKKRKSLDAELEEYQRGKEESDQRLEQERAEQEQIAREEQEASVPREKLHWWNFIKKYKRAKQLKLEAAKEQEEEQEDPQQTADNSKAHKEFVKQLQKNSTIDAIVNKEMLSTKDKIADIRREFEDQDK